MIEAGFERVSIRSFLLHLSVSVNQVLCVCVQSLSCVLVFVTSWMVTHQAPVSVGFPRQEYWSELPFPSPGDLPNPGIDPTSLASPLAGGLFIAEPPGKPKQVLAEGIKLNPHLMKQTDLLHYVILSFHPANTVYLSPSPGRKYVLHENH